MSSIEETKNIKAVMIFEIIGKPPEHLNETLDSIINKIDFGSWFLINLTLIFGLRRSDTDGNLDFILGTLDRF